MSVRRPTIGVVVALLAGVLVLLCASVPASASYKYLSHASFGAACSSAPCGDGQFKEPTGVAVNRATEVLLQPTAGDVYVIDTGDTRVERFGATGSYLGQFNGAGGYETEGKTTGGPATPGGSFSFSTIADGNGIAVDGSVDPLDPSAGDVYVMDVGHQAIDRFSAVGRYEGQLTGTCPAPGSCAGSEVIPFAGELLGVAVDRAGNVWSYESEGNVDEFSDAGAFVASFNTSRGTNAGFAVDGNDNAYPAFGSKRVGRFESSSEVSEFGSEQEQLTALTVSPTSDEVLLDQGSFVERFAPITESAPHATESFGQLAESHGIAVNTAPAPSTPNVSEILYVSQSGSDNVEIFDDALLPDVSAESSDLSETGVTLEGTVTPDGEPIAACQFEYGTTSGYGQSVPCEQSLSEINRTGDPVIVTAKLSDLPPASVRHFALVATNANGPSSSADETISRPVIEEGTVSTVAATEVTLTAQIDPEGLTSSYHVEYGTGDVEELTTPEKSVGTANGPVNVSVSLRGLQAGASYRFRFVASNPLGVSEGAEAAFVTPNIAAGGTSATSCPNRAYSGFSASLPDCRAYELVSSPIDETYTPADGQGAHGPQVPEWDGANGGYRAAEDGDALAYTGGESNTGVGGNGKTGNTGANNYLSVRGAAGWSASDISLPVNPNKGASQYEAFSHDLSVQVFKEAASEVSAEPSPLAECVSDGEGTIYSRDSSGAHSLITMNQGSGLCYAEAGGISANDKHVLFAGPAPYTSEAKQSAGFGDNNLFDSIDGVVRQVNVLPDGEPEQQPHATFGARFGIDAGEERDEENLLGDISADGSRIVWTALEGEAQAPQSKALYVRENDSQPQSPVSGGACAVPADACTVQVDASQGGTGTGGGGYYWAASSGGARIFFTDCSRLTETSTADAQAGCIHVSGNTREPASFTGNDLYEYDLEKPPGQRLTDLTVDHDVSDTLGADVQGVIGVSENGGYVYFVAHGVLAGMNSEAKAPLAGQPNLYMSHDGVITFVVTLEAEDDMFNYGILTSGDWLLDAGRRTAEVAPNGRAVSFMSRQELTGYRNYGVVGYENESSGGSSSPPTYGRIPEVFVYQVGTGHVVCVSCSPIGAPPAPISRPAARAGLSAGAIVGVSQSHQFMPRWLNEEGTQLYFMTTQPLAPSDSNGLQDVYEWESDGEGGCAQAAGCVDLISDAGPASNAFFVDASKSGGDVFFTDRSPLTADAIDETLKLYDARVDGGSLQPSEACTGTGCQGTPPSLPIFATPSSVTFNGVGNFAPPVAKPSPKSKLKPSTRAQKLAKALKSCRRESRRKRASCEAQAREKYGAKSNPKAKSKPSTRKRR